MVHKTKKFTVKRCACGTLIPKYSSHSECVVCYLLTLECVAEIAQAKHIR